MNDEDPELHDDFMSFLNNPNRNSIFDTPLPRLDLDIASGCLTFMTQELECNSCHFDINEFQSLDDHAIKNMVDTRMSAALRYCCLVWMRHLTLRTPLDQWKMRALDVDWLAWLEVVYIAGSDAVVSDGLNALRSHADMRNIQVSPTLQQ
jgi:hypothetical protein